jgi:eukaryotic-like serine/threonine-protein kinase
MPDTFCRKLADKLAVQVPVAHTCKERVCHGEIVASVAGMQRALQATAMAVTSATRAFEQRSLRTGDMVSAYRIDRQIGTGGMGWVFRAWHLIDDRFVALKVLREDQLRQDRAVDRMMREAQVLATVSHGGVPRFYECGLLCDGRPWIAMELIHGTPLSVRMAEGAMPYDEVIELVANVAGVLAAAHTHGVTHRDLKPDNILLTATDPTYQVRVIDWGIAHHIAGARYTHHDEAIGTPTYMAPEQARGGPVDGYSDIYGLGVVAYHALTGRPPFRGSSAVEILVQHLNKPVPPLAPRCPEAPIGLVELVERMLDKDCETRPSASEVQAALDKLRADPSYMFVAAEATAPCPRLDDEHATVLVRPPILR